MRLDGPADLSPPTGCTPDGSTLSCAHDPIAPDVTVQVVLGIDPTGMSDVTIAVDGQQAVVPAPPIGDGPDSAIRLSRERFPDAGAFAQAGATATPVVLARDDVFADSVGGTLLTGDGPILFTAGDRLDASRRSPGCSGRAASCTC